MTTERVTIRASSRIKAQMRFWQDSARQRLYVGGVGSGKTTAGVLEILRQPPGSTGMVIAPTFDMLRQATKARLDEICERANIIRSHSTLENKTVLKNGTTIYYRQGDVKPERLRGPSLNWAYLDEGAYLSSEVFRVVLGRLRRKPGKLWITTTPRGRSNWVYKRFVESPKPTQSVIHTKTTDNVYLPEEFISDLREQYKDDPAYAQQEMDGEFVDLSKTKRFPSALLSSLFARAAPLTPPPNFPPLQTRMYRLPKPGQRYIVGIDCAEGLPTGDDTALAVVTELGELACVVAGSFEPQEETGALARDVCGFYNNASANIERNNHGHAVIASAKRYGVHVLKGHDKRDGFHTTQQTKTTAYNHVAHLFSSARDEGRTLLQDYRQKEQLAQIDRRTLSNPDKKRLVKVDDEATAYVVGCAGFLQKHSSARRGRAALANSW